ncbi:MFS transporter [Microbacterium capsulatum]|uniref:MFS transporter n=1 Tax=Microbacterium capsulatum TaxID=3041921 RepID=A0ABU0XM24_9MICO|nr:MFS transporter [Microbacterium sp. ASV81]MDQ4215160.1 MFS transporter [Microbacterium sp. ASV81]
MTKPETHRKTPAKAAIASWVGTTLEYYDFAVYGTASALVLNVLFFSKDLNPGISTLLAMVTLAVGYAVRPLGALVLGPLADRFGRKFVMMLTLFGIGGCTFLIGCLPTYSQVGALAPILLVVIRVIQGLCVSGEQGSAITMSLEHAPEKRRGFITSFTTSGSASGGLLATGVFIPFAALPQEQLLGWAWRVPFWLSAVVVVAAYIIRRRLQEPPVFLETQAVKVRIAPLTQALRFHWVAIIRVAACALIAGVSYVFDSFSVAFATTGYHLDKPTILWVGVITSMIAFLFTPLAGLLSDLIGRKTVFLIGAVGAGALMMPYLWSITTGNWPLIFALGILCKAFFYSTVNAAWPAFFAEMFPNRVRASGLTVGTQIGFAIAGGVAPVISAALAGSNLQNWFGPAMFALAITVIAAIAALTAKETRRYTLDEIDELQQSEREREVVTAAIELPTTV